MQPGELTYEVPYLGEKLTFGEGKIPGALVAKAQCEAAPHMRVVF